MVTPLYTSVLYMFAATPNLFLVHPDTFVCWSPTQFADQSSYLASCVVASNLAIVAGKVSVDT